MNSATNQPYGLATTITTSAYQVSGTPGDTTGVNSQKTQIGYEKIGTDDKTGWALGKETSTTEVMPGGSDVVTRTRYDDNGRVIEKRLPNDDGTGPRTTLTSYYSAGGSGSCSDPTRAGLVCTTGPAGQPSTGAPLPVTNYSYDQYGKQTARTETFGNGSNQVVRTSATTYGAGERAASTSVSVTPSVAGGAALPSVNTAYASETGLPVAVSTTSGGATTSLITSYDSLGRKIKYVDASGNVSTTTYASSGRVTSTRDGKHTTSYVTDSASEHRGLVTSEDIGVTNAPSVFAASYDAAGNMATETFPNGVVATRRFDNAGNLTSLAYAKGGTRWMTFTQDVNALGQIARQSSHQSSQVFTYDPAARLTSVRDTYQGACVTRSYKFDDHSNRTDLASSQAASDGTCSTAGPTSTHYSYDGGDRLTSDTPGGTYSYDMLGRATSVPAGDAQGTGSHAATGGDVGLAYYANDMVSRETQGGVTDTFTLDPRQSRIYSQVDGSATTVNHYDGDDDNPAWTSSGSTWTEYETDLAGNLAANVTQADTVSLQFSNPHGDVVASMPDDVNVSPPTTITETTEYGAPRDRAGAPTKYGWIGSKQRSSDDLGGLLVMGVRLYNPAIGRFTAVDPMPGGTPNAYDYPLDPISQFDTTGMFQATCGYATCTITPQYGSTRFLLRNQHWAAGVLAIAAGVLGRGAFGVMAGIIIIGMGVMRNAFSDHKLTSWKFDNTPLHNFLYWKTYRNHARHSWRY